MPNKVSQLVIVCRNITVDWNQFSNPIYVGVESGCLSLIENNRNPTLFCGDFDSVTATEWNQIKTYQQVSQIPIIKTNSEKDVIDAELAIITAKNRLLSFEQIFIISAGERWDMILAQINLIRKYQQYPLTLIDEVNYVFAVKTGTEFIFNHNLLNYDYLSFFPLTSKTTTYQLSGCKYYPNQKITINQKDVLAVSNEFNKINSNLPVLKILDGDCLVILTKKVKKF